MRKIIYTALAVATTLFISSVNAGTWVNGMKVNGVQSTADGGFIIYGPPNTGPNCPEGGKLFYVRDGFNGQTPDGVKVTLSVVLVAFSSGKEITFAYDETSPSCYVNTVLVNP